MEWKKKGLIYCANKDAGWKFQGALLPTPILLKKDLLRIYVGFCDKDIVGRIGFVDVLPDDPSHIIKVSEKPVLDIGRNGCFDDNGVVPVSVLRKEDKIFLYYVGFSKGVKVPYYMFLGLAISYDNGETFQRHSQCPVLDRFNNEVYARCGAFVFKDEDMFRMWYVGTYKDGWTQKEDTLKPLYIMKHITSHDAIRWNEPSVDVLSYSNKDEHGFGRPYVWKESGIYKMLYSIRTYSHNYHIGYAESADGIVWVRKDDLAGIESSKDGWDSENISYPFLFSHDKKTYMFYNGNGYGKSGFGYAELVGK